MLRATLSEDRFSADCSQTLFHARTTTKENAPHVYDFYPCYFRSILGAADEN